jgi:hypothetical protein
MAKDVTALATQKRIEIRIQTNRRVVIYATGLGRTWCKQCGTDREVVTVQTAGLLAESLLFDLRTGVLPTELHVFPSTDGSPRICLESLLQLARGESKFSESNGTEGPLSEQEE